MEINYRNLKAGQKITVVTAWTESETFEDISNGHFFETKIESVYFEPRHDGLLSLKIWANDGDGEKRLVKWVLENNRVKSTAVMVTMDELKGRSEMICLTDRKPEFLSASERAKKSDLEVYSDFEPDRYVVVNFTSGKEYRVKLHNENGLAFASCECGDFIHRDRICKHICAVLTDTLFGYLAKKEAAAV